MKVNGIEIPEWMAKNNSVEQIEKWMKAGKKPAQKPVNNKDFNPDDHTDPGNWGIFIIRTDGMPAIVALGLTEETAVITASQLQEQQPALHIELFESYTFDADMLE